MNKRVYQLIILLPIIDIATAFTEEWTLSIGAIIRTLLMALVIIYIWIIEPMKKQYRLVFLLAYILTAVTFVSNFFMKTPFYLMEEVSFMLKVAYFITMISLVIHIITTKQIEQIRFLRVVHIALFIVSSTYWLAYFTNTNLNSYAYVKSGYSGWYFSANELSVIILILFALVLVYFLHTWTNLTTFTIIITLFIFPMIGTKTALYGGLILFIPILLYAFFKRKWQHAITLSILLGLLFVYIPFTAASTNQLDTANHHEVETDEQQHSLLSSRDVYLETTLQDYRQAPFLRQMVGLGYAGDYKKAAKTIEMDFYDLFFSFGWLGTIILLLPLALLSYKITRWKLTFPYMYSMGTLLLTIGISFVAGHVLFAPAVMSYVALLVIWIGSIANE